MKNNPPVIGWRERIKLPEWNLRLLAKIDTGAKTSSIDVASVERLPGNRIRFFVRRTRRGKTLRALEADIYKETRVKSSNGIVQERYVVRTDLVMAGVTKPICITLTCRKKMLHRMLLGREALEHDFLIDAALDHRDPGGGSKGASGGITRTGKGSVTEPA